jgi:predicted deacetylase
MSAAQTQYLLRMDDLCPTMDRVRWARFAEVIARHGVRPILAVVPDNRDPDLVRGDADPEFWEKMRAHEADGASIGLHGYRHVCAAQGRGLVPMHKQTEFAGVPYERQREWIAAGLKILRSHGLNPRVWVAPRHGFDAQTVRALREEGMEAISDGWARRPYRELGMVWIPQQIWAPVEMPAGVWTICLHSNSAREAEVRELDAFLRRFAGQFTSLEQALDECPGRKRTMRDRWFGVRSALRAQLLRMRPVRS